MLILQANSALTEKMKCSQEILAA